MVTKQGRDAGSTIAVVIAVGAFLLAAIGVGVVATNDSSSSSSASSSAPSGPISVSLTEFKITPAAMTANPGDITFEVKNDGTMVHNFDIPDLGVTTPDIEAGGSATLTVPSVAAGTYTVICSIPGHEAAGMKATLTVGAASASGSSGASMAGMDTGSGANPNDAKIDFSADAPAGFTARDPNAPAPLPGTVHNITFEMNETELEVAPGVKQLMFTFNEEGQPATVPGPILRGKIGDTFNIHLVNKGKMDHSMDFHASKVAWDKEMANVKPGESADYNFVANYSGIWMYHCGTNPTLHHIGNGMYGAVIIDPPNLAPVDHEYVIVQSELYTGPDGEPGDLAKMQDDAWDAVVFNGYVNQYKFKPIRVEKDERIRVWVMDDGPSENSSFHIVGTIFDTTYKEGRYLVQPDATHGASQALDLQPAQGGFVEFSLAEEGFYPMVTHKFSNVGKGALGLFQAGDVTLAAGASH